MFHSDIQKDCSTYIAIQNIRKALNSNNWSAYLRYINTNIEFCEINDTDHKTVSIVSIVSNNKKTTQMPAAFSFADNFLHETIMELKCYDFS